jgi:ATP-dependent DNA ligase
MVIPTPLTLVSQGQPFDDPDWLYEIKHDGFRALAVVENGRCRFFSRNKHRLTGFRDLAEALCLMESLLQRMVGAEPSLPL